MAIRINDGARNQALDSGLATAFDGGTAVLEIRTGAQPAAASDAATGTLIVSITLPADAFAAASSGAIAKAGTWSGTASNAGTAGWFRLRNAGDTIRLDGAVGSDITFDNTSVSNGATVTIATFTITQPAS